MNVVSQGGLPAAGMIWQPRRDTWVATVACEVTFVLAPGTCTISTSREPLVEEDQFIGDDERRVLGAPRDLVPVKPNVDVLVVGHAFAPGERPVTSLVARIAVGDMTKSVPVHGDRSVGADGVVCWGSSCEVGDSPTAPARAPALGRVRSLVEGCALHPAGDVDCFESDSSGSASRVLRVRSLPPRRSRGSGARPAPSSATAA